MQNEPSHNKTPDIHKKRINVSPKVVTSNAIATTSQKGTFVEPVWVFCSLLKKSDTRKPAVRVRVRVRGEIMIGVKVRVRDRIRIRIRIRVRVRVRVRVEVRVRVRIKVRVRG